MTRIDRYVLVLFLRTVFICFCSLAGIFIVFHAFTSMGDFSRQAEQEGSLTWVMARFYGPYMLLLFDMTGTVVTLMAMLFAVGWLRRTGELTATIAAGVSHGRIVRPIVIASLAIILVQLANREFFLPRLRDNLSMQVKVVTEEFEEPILQRYDKTSGILFSGDALKPKSREIKHPSFRIFGDYEGFGDLLTADSATWIDATADHPSGYLLENVKRPKKIDQLRSVGIDDQLILMTSQDQPWLNSRQCFVATTVQTQLLQTNQSSKRLLSVAELVGRVRDPAVYSSTGVRVFLHERIIRVPLDFALICLGLPLLANRRQRNVFVMVGMAIGIILFFFAAKTLAGTMGGSGYLLSPAMAGWFPLLIIGPFAYGRLREIQTV